MKILILCSFLVLNIIMFPYSGYSQSASLSHNSEDIIQPLKKGDQIPDVLFVSKENFPKEINSVYDYKGKIVLLDFWSTGCPGCIAAFPKMESLQKKYADRLQIILVNPWETSEKVKERLTARKITNFKYPDLPRVNGDSIWAQLFPTKTIPHHVWLNEEGGILAVTGGYNANETTIDALIRGEERNMVLKPSVSRMDLSKKSFIETISNELIRQEPGANFYAFYEGEGGSVYGYDALNVIDSLNNTIRFSFINTTPIGMVKQLFKNVGKAENEKEQLTSDITFIEIKDSSVFCEKVPYELYDDWSRKVKFCAEVILPLDKKAFIYQCAFDQLQAYIREKYKMQISIEERSKACLILTQISKNNLLQTKGGESKTIYPQEGETRNITYVNTDFNSVFRSVEFHVNSAKEIRTTILNEVPYTGNADMVLPYIYAEPHRLGEFKKALNRYGLDLVEANRKVKVFVVRDIK